MKEAASKGPSNPTSSTSSKASAAKSPPVQRQAQPIIPLPFFTSPLAAPFLQRKAACPCDGGCPQCSGSHTAVPLPISSLPVLPPPISSLQRKENDSCEIEKDPDEPVILPTEEETESTGADKTAQPKSRAQHSADSTGSGFTNAPEKTPHNQKNDENNLNSPDNVAAIESGINSGRGRGTPLHSDTRDFMETRFGYDFRDVRIHTGGNAAQMNRRLNSFAFTSGTDIFFAPNYYHPGTTGGDRLLAHELTHVVQQSSGSDGGTVREKSSPRIVNRNNDPNAKGFTDYEDKGYYKREPITGRAVHHLLEKELRAVDANLVTEAPIPGSVSNFTGLNKVGFADLYKARPNKKISGVRGVDQVYHENNIWSMPACGSANLKTEPCSPTNRGPTRPPRVKGARGWKGDFPAKIWVGEIKPLGLRKLGAGMAQVENYKFGYQEFVEEVNKFSNKVTCPSIKTATLTKLTIPAGLNYLYSNKARGKNGAGKVEVGPHRFWIYPLRKYGLYVYFSIDKDFDQTVHDPWVKAQIKILEDIRKPLTKKHPRTPGLKAAAKFRSTPTKWISPSTSSPLSPKPITPKPTTSKSTTSKSITIQRKTTKGPKYWKQEGKKWETTRKGWGKKIRNYFKKKGKGLKKKMEVDKRLGIKKTATDPMIKKNAAKLQSLFFWSGTKGKFVGKVRFLMGAAFARIQAVFNKMKKKMKKIRTRSGKISGKGFGLFGWRKTLIRVLLEAAKIGVARFITMSFNVFAQCFDGAMRKAVGMFKEEMNEQYATQLCTFKNRFQQSRKRLEKEWGGVIDSIKDLIKTIKDVSKWIQIASGLITLIRLGVQIVSCLTPPALGCLWGLVAQIGLSAALGLLVGTEWFNQNIVTPTIGKIIRNYATPKYKSLINRVLGPDLKEFHCQISEPSPGSGGVVIPLRSKLAAVIPAPSSRSTGTIGKRNMPAHWNSCWVKNSWIQKENRHHESSSLNWSRF